MLLLCATQCHRMLPDTQMLPCTTACQLSAAATLPNCNQKQSVPNALPNASTPLCFRSDSDGYRSATSMLGATKCSRTLHHAAECSRSATPTMIPQRFQTQPCATTKLPMQCRRAALRKCCLRVPPQSYLCATTYLPMCCRHAALRKCHASMCYQMLPKCSLSATNSLPNAT